MIKLTEPVFVMACLRDNVGSNTAFHAVDGMGYTTNLDKAQKLTKEEAQRRWNSAREFDLPLDFEKIEAHAIFKVDCQYIPRETTTDDSQCYVAFKKGVWDGNDVYWLTGGHILAPSLNGLSTNFTDARLMKSPYPDDDYISIPFALAEAAKRRTFAHGKINKRKMVQGSGLVTPKHIKKQKRRKINPMTRWNCPGCGRIHWQYNPHDFEGCNDVNCVEWVSIKHKAY